MSLFPIFNHPYFTLLKLSQDYISHCCKCHTTTFHFISIFTQSHITFFRLSHDHISHCSNFQETTCQIIPNFTRPRVTLSSFLTHILHYSNSHGNITHISNSHKITCHNFSICHTTTTYLNSIVNLPKVALFRLSHNHI